MFLIRHGAHDLLGKVLCGRAPGVTLGAEGLSQASNLALRLKRERIAALFSSPLERARQTAAPVALALGLPVQLDDDLNELDFGAWSGRRFDELHGDPLWTQWNSERLSCRPPGGESFQEAQARVVGWLTRIAAAFSGRAVAAFSHADLIKAALAHALGLPLERHDRFEISPGAVSIVVAGDWGMKVHSMNEVLP